MDLNDKIYIAGHRGLVGSAIMRQLESRGFDNLVTRSRQELDLTSQSEVKDFFAEQTPDYVILAAAKVGGIYANNTYPAELIYENMMIEANVIYSAYRCGARRLLFLSSTCIYPREVQQPMREDALLTNVLEPTNEPYAVAKIAGIKLCESFNRQHGTDFRSVVPTNLYGPGDNYHSENSHVIPAMIRRFHEAKINSSPNVSIWGTGSPRREFLYVDDLARACIHVMSLDKSIYDKHTQPMLSHINIGVGFDMTIHELATTIKDVVGYHGEIIFDRNKPDGTPQKLMNSSRIVDLGWQAKIDLNTGLVNTYKDFLQRC